MSPKWEGALMSGDDQRTKRGMGAKPPANRAHEVGMTAEAIIASRSPVALARKLREAALILDSPFHRDSITRCMLNAADALDDAALLAERYRALVKFYDDHAGTPCEHIRHQQEAAELRTQVATLNAEIEALRKADRTF